jgi:hypothetical protein
MSGWTREEIEEFALADDLHVAPFRDDGTTFGTSTWVWSVVVDGGLYARAYSGTASRWYGAAVKQGGGRITIAGSTHDVSFIASGADLESEIDAAYTLKYRGSAYLAAMVSPRAGAATVRIERTYAPVTGA